jgi:hypothetical protein
LRTLGLLIESSQLLLHLCPEQGLRINKPVTSGHERILAPDADLVEITLFSCDNAREPNVLWISTA